MVLLHKILNIIKKKKPQKNEYNVKQVQWNAEG